MENLKRQILELHELMASTESTHGGGEETGVDHAQGIQNITAQTQCTNAMRSIPQIVPLRKAGGRPRCSLECLRDPSKSFTFAGSKQHGKDRYVCLDCKDYAKKFLMCRKKLKSTTFEGLSRRVWSDGTDIDDHHICISITSGRKLVKRKAHSLPLPVQRLIPKIEPIQEEEQEATATREIFFRNSSSIGHPVAGVFEQSSPYAQGFEPNEIPMESDRAEEGAEESFIRQSGGRESAPSAISHIVATSSTSRPPSVSGASETANWNRQIMLEREVTGYTVGSGIGMSSVGRNMDPIIGNPRFGLPYNQFRGFDRGFRRGRPYPRFGMSGPRVPLEMHQSNRNTKWTNELNQIKARGSFDFAPSNSIMGCPTVANTASTRPSNLSNFSSEQRAIVSKNDNAPWAESGKHPVSLLMELCAKQHWNPPTFTCSDVQGTGAVPKFLSEVTVNGFKFATHYPTATKKEAKLEAAKKALRRVNY